MSSGNNNSNNYTQAKGFGASPSVFGNTGMAAPQPSVPGKPMFGQPQAQPQMNGGFQNQFQPSQAQAIAQAQSKAQAQAAQAQFQAQLQAQGLTLNSSQNTGMGGSPSPGISLSGGAGAKRFPQKPPTRPPGPSTLNSASPLKTMELTPAARRKKQKSSEKDLQDRVAAILPESALYTQLLEFESRVDAALMRKKVDIQEALKNPPCLQKTLRIYVFNTFANQNQTIPNMPNAEPPTWTL
uniref:SWI/SNF-related matrix-associated actin-dependent regulator n=1 Tax=Sedum alfredii TaxID=439688 RepID=A0A8E4XYY4_9MAGN|nr:SWI/SNF-related matrix-associated actin-dependent regulator [Sedum alfredii]